MKPELKLPTDYEIATYLSADLTSSLVASAKWMRDEYAQPLQEMVMFLLKRIDSVERESVAAKKCLFEYEKIKKENQKLKAQLEVAVKTLTHYKRYLCPHIIISEESYEFNQQYGQGKHATEALSKIEAIERGDV